MSNPRPPAPLWKVIGGVALAASLFCVVLTLANAVHSDGSTPAGATTSAAPTTASPVAASSTTMPDVSGQTVSAATATLHDLFPSAQIAVEGNAGPNDTVGSTLPAVGALALGWSVIYLYPAAPAPAAPPATTTTTTDETSAPSDSPSGSGSDSGGDHYIPHPHVHVCLGGRHVHVCS